MSALSSRIRRRLHRLTCRALGSSVLVLSCNVNAPAFPAAHVHAGVQVGRRCPELATRPRALSNARVRVFVELAHLLPGQLPEPLGDWLEHHPVAVRSVSNLLLTPTRPVVVPWGACLDSACDTRSQSWTASLVVLPTTAQPLSLSLQLRQGSGAPSERAKGTNPAPLLTARLQLASQEPTLVRGAKLAVGADELLATAYVLVDAEDLFRLMRCKGEQVGLEELRPRPAMDP